MPKADDRELAVAGLYARSILGLAVESGKEDDFLEEMQDLAGLVEKDAALEDFFGSPLVDLGERAEAIERWFRGKASDLLVNSLQVLNRKGRLGILPTIAEVLRQEHQKLRRRVDVHVRTAVPLADSTRKKLQKAASDYVGREAQLIEVVDPELLGGLVLQVGDQKIDGSLKRELEEMRDALEVRSAHELHRMRQESAA